MKNVLLLLAGVSLLPLATAQDARPPATPADLTPAIAEMRNLPVSLVGREAEERGPRIHAAWQTLIAAGDAGAKALLAEAARLSAVAARDDRFRLGAAAVVWQIGRHERAQDVLTLWADADFAVKYTYAFWLAFDAARSGDDRALPLLQALLRDQRGTFYVADHAMELAWPLTHAFLWGPMGRKAVPALAEALAKAEDPTVIASAITLLADSWQTEILPRARMLAGNAAHGARNAAIRALGKFGHPEDFEFLVAGLASAEPEQALAHVEALCGYGDLRAVPHLVPLTRHVDETVRMPALAALGLLATIDGLEVLADRIAALDEGEREWLEQGPQLLQDIEVGWNEYNKLDRAQRGALLARARAKAEAEFRVQEGDRQLTRAEFDRACPTWIAASRIHTADHEWIEARHLLAIATPADLPLLLDLRGCLFRRLSDECLEEVAIVDRTLKRLVRSQYRREPGVCERVEPVATAKERTK